MAAKGRSAIDSLELTDIVGRLLLVGFEGRDFAEVEKLLVEVRPAGLIFFRRNYPETGGLAELSAFIGRARALTLEITGRRLLIAIDHEGGTIQRLPAPFTRLPAARETALNGGVLAAVEWADIGARELAAVGFNFNLAPVVDVANMAGGFIGDRAFSNEPEIVATWAAAVLATFRRVGILGAAKHFPGLGAAQLDPHHEMPVILLDLERLTAVDLLPYRVLAANPDLTAVMTAHAFYPALDVHNPATFSREIVGLLKNKMNFAGAVLTDDLEMGAVVKNYSPGEAVVAAVVAGHDLALICRGRDYLDECRLALAEALRSGILAPERLADALARTENLTQHLARYDNFLESE